MNLIIWKNFYKVFLVSVFLLLLCNHCNEVRKDNHQNYSLSFVDSVYFHLDSASSANTIAMFYHEFEGKRLLVYLDRTNNHLHYFDIDNGYKRNSIAISSYGKNAVPDIMGFYCRSFDSIYLPSSTTLIFVMNRMGEVIDRIDYYNGQGIDELLPAYSLSRFHSPLIFRGNSLFALQSYGQMHIECNDPSCYKFCYKINLSDKQSELMPIHHPSDFWDKGIKEGYVSWDYNGSDFIYSPLRSHYIYLSHDNIKIDRSVLIQSNNLNDFMLYEYSFNSEVSPEKYFNEYLTHGEYIGIMYDKFRDIYYRFYWPGYDGEPLRGEEAFKKYMNPPNFGIMVFDRDYNVIFDTLLPDNIYSQHKYFIAEEGLYLSADHPENPNLKENEWRFDIFGLSNSPVMK